MEKFELTVKVKKENLNLVNEAVEKTMSEAGASEGAVISVDIAVDEIFSNIVYYSGLGEADDVKIVGTIEDEGEACIALEFVDRGKPFNPLEMPEPDVTKPAEERKIGGLGIYMVKKSMDRVSYRNEDGCNIFTIVKKI